MIVCYRPIFPFIIQSKKSVDIVHVVAVVVDIKKGAQSGAGAIAENSEQFSDPSKTFSGTMNSHALHNSRRVCLSPNSRMHGLNGSYTGFRLENTISSAFPPFDGRLLPAEPTPRGSPTGASTREQQLFEYKPPGLGALAVPLLEVEIDLSDPFSTNSPPDQVDCFSPTSGAWNVRGGWTGPLMTIKSIEMSLKYLYGFQPTLTPETVPSMLYTAAYFDLGDLTSRIADYCFLNLSTTNVVPLLLAVLGREHGEAGRLIEDSAIAYLHRNAIDVGASYLSALPLSMQLKILSANELWVTTEFARAKLCIATKRACKARVIAGAQRAQAAALLTCNKKNRKGWTFQSETNGTTLQDKMSNLLSASRSNLQNQMDDTFYNTEVSRPTNSYLLSTMDSITGQAFDRTGEPSQILPQLRNLQGQLGHHPSSNRDSLPSYGLDSSFRAGTVESLTNGSESRGRGHLLVFREQDREGERDGRVGNTLASLESQRRIGHKKREHNSLSSQQHMRSDGSHSLSNGNHTSNRIGIRKGESGLVAIRDKGEMQEDNYDNTDSRRVNDTGKDNGRVIYDLSSMSSMSLYSDKAHTASVSTAGQSYELWDRNSSQRRNMTPSASAASRDVTNDMEGTVDREMYSGIRSSVEDGTTVWSGRIQGSFALNGKSILPPTIAGSCPGVLNASHILNSHLASSFSQIALAEEAVASGASMEMQAENDGMSGQATRIDQEVNTVGRVDFINGGQINRSLAHVEERADEFDEDPSQEESNNTPLFRPTQHRRAREAQTQFGNETSTNGIHAEQSSDIDQSHARLQLMRNEMFPESSRGMESFRYGPLGIPNATSASESTTANSSDTMPLPVTPPPTAVPSLSDHGYHGSLPTTDSAHHPRSNSATDTGSGEELNNSSIPCLVTSNPVRMLHNMGSTKLSAGVSTSYFGGRPFGEGHRTLVSADLGSNVEAEDYLSHIEEEEDVVMGGTEADSDAWYLRRNFEDDVLEVENTYDDIFRQLRLVHCTAEQLQELREEKEICPAILDEAEAQRKKMLEKLELANRFNVKRLDELNVLTLEDGVTDEVKELRWQPARYGVEVSGVFSESMTPTSEVEARSMSSERFAHAGSLWVLDLKRYLQPSIPVDGMESHGPTHTEAVAVYLRRRKLTPHPTINSTDTFEDTRERTTLAFTIRLCGAPGAPTSNSVCGRSTAGKPFGTESEVSWGWEVSTLAF